MHQVEKELIKVSGYKARAKFADRQEYLKSILNAVSKLTDDDFDALSDEAAAWANAAVDSANSKSKDSEIPDFDQVEASDDDPDGAEETAEDETTEEASEDDDEEAEDEEASDDDHDPETGEVTETEDDEPELELEPVKPKKGAKKAPVKAAPKAAPKKAEKPAEKPAKEASKPKHRNLTPNERKDAVLDKFGAIEGSKNSQALALFEKGATSKEVKDDLGGTYYNILKRAVQAGHRIEKVGSLITLTHKDNLGKKAVPSKPAAKKGKK